MATDQTRALAAGTDGLNSETSITARATCVGGGRKWGRVQMGEPESEPGPVDGDYTGALLGSICIVLPVDFNS